MALFKQQIISFKGGNEPTIRLFAFLYEHCFHYNALIPSKKYVWHHLFGKKKYNDSLLRKYMSQLTKKAEDFLVYQAIKKNPSRKDNFLLQELTERGLNTDFNQLMKKAHHSSISRQHRNTKYYHHQHTLAAISNSFLTKQGARTKETNLVAAMDNLDYYYLINKLKHSCEILNTKNVMDIDYEPVLIDEILEHVDHKKYDHIPAIAIYYNILMLLKDDIDPSYYKRLKELLQKYSDLFEEDEIKEIYTYGINYCIKKVNKGEAKYLEELYHFYKQALKKDALIENNYLTPWSYKNIIAVGLRMGKFEWTENFIYSYRERITPESRKNAFTYNLAKLHFHKKEYDQVMELLQQVVYDDVFYNLDSKAMLLKTYYELQEFEPLHSLIDSFRIFLRRNKLISDSHRTNYLNLVRFVRKASKVTEGDRKKIDNLRNEINNTAQIADINWLKEKITELH